MKTLPLVEYFPEVSRIAFGCMGLGGGWNNNPIDKHDIDLANQAVDVALENGINFFDHADIYTMGKAEQVFGTLLKQRPELKSQMILQSKCGIRLGSENAPGRYDHSKAWITTSVEQILSRLQVEQLDILLLHRPDPLMDAEEVAETFASLRQAGKVKHFGVSNMHRHQMEWLNANLEQPLVVNQVEMSLAKHGFVEQGVTVGMDQSAQVGFDTGLLEYCQQNAIQLQSWGSLAQGLYTGRDVSEEPENVQRTVSLVAQLAAEYQVSREAVVLGWMLKLPQAIQPVIGTTNPQRIAACSEAEKLAKQLSREHWYELFVSARGANMP